MEDIDIRITLKNGKEIVINTSMIEEDVIRMMCGLNKQEQK